MEKPDEPNGRDFGPQKKQNPKENNILFILNYALQGKKKKGTFINHIKAEEKKVFFTLRNILKAGYLATLLMKLVFVTLILSIAPPLDVYKTKYLVRKGVL